MVCADHRPFMKCSTYGINLSALDYLRTPIHERFAWEGRSDEL